MRSFIWISSFSYPCIQCIHEYDKIHKNIKYDKNKIDKNEQVKTRWQALYTILTFYPHASQLFSNELGILGRRPCPNPHCPINLALRRVNRSNMCVSCKISHRPIFQNFKVISTTNEFCNNIYKYIDLPLWMKISLLTLFCIIHVI